MSSALKAKRSNDKETKSEKRGKKETMVGES